jgi:N-acetylneuraminic acid mutarotase
MELQEIGYKVGRGFAWFSVCLVVCESLIIVSISRAADDTWTKKADMLTVRAFLATSAVNGRIYAIGGRTVPGPTPPPILPVEEYDPATNTWRKRTGMPTARQALSTSVVNGKIYAIGGWSGPGIFRSTVEEYDPATDTWRKKADMPTARSQLSTSMVNGKIYAIGGKIGADAPLPTVEEYDPATDTWREKADMPTARAALSASVVDGKIYAIGGATSAWAQTSAVEEYDIGSVLETSVDAKGKLAAVWGDIKRGR